MKADQVDQALTQKFVTEGQRLVFWHDAKGEFVDYIGGGLAEGLSDVHVLNLGEVGAFTAKLRLEREDRQGKYLIYSQGEAPAPEVDWLLDVREYSAQFHADVASIWLQDLGLASLSLREHLQARSVFLRTQRRRTKLKRLIDASDDANAVDLKMMTVLVGSALATPFDVLRALCHGHCQGASFDLTNEPEVIGEFEKMDLLDGFWGLMHREFGYAADVPTIAGLVRRLFVSELQHSLSDASVSALKHHELPTDGRQNAVVFLTQWRDSSGHAESYDAAAAAVALEQGLDDVLQDLELEALEGVFTFWDAERRVVSLLKDRVLSDETLIDLEGVQSLVADRRAGHWLARAATPTSERGAVACAYLAIKAAAELFVLYEQHRHSLTFESPAALLAAYRSELYRFDRRYRDFCTHARPAMGQNWDLLKALGERVERLYGDGFLQALGLEWSKHLDAGFLSQWSLRELPAQQDFFAKQIAPHIKGAGGRKAFVIISDAFRYEAATQLVESVNSVYRHGASLDAMLGVLPSYTALGMASLLPHDALSFSESGDVLVDGKSTAGTAARGKQLATVNGMACQAKDLRVMKQNDAREFIGDHRVIYIYHNVIDARGDSASTEGETFEAVTQCVQELSELVQFCINRLNAGKVWVTADHGFLYQHAAPVGTDKSTLSHKPAQAVKHKKRYVVGPGLGPVPEAHHGTTKDTVGAEGGMEFWVPRSANRFHFTGGARFTHGGAMPQEIVIPLVTVTHVRGKQKAATRSEKVAVQVLGANHKITTPSYRFEVIQTEAVSDRKHPLTVRAAVYEGDQPVTSIETATFDSASDLLDERKRTIRVELAKGTFDKSKAYRLVLRDAETEAEVQIMPVVIDRSFDVDF